jgi:hypothetical protein
MNRDLLDHNPRGIHAISWVEITHALLDECGTKGTNFLFRRPDQTLSFRTPILLIPHVTPIPPRSELKFWSSGFPRPCCRFDNVKSKAVARNGLCATFRPGKDGKVLPPQSLLSTPRKCHRVAVSFISLSTRADLDLSNKFISRLSARGLVHGLERSPPHTRIY